MLISWSVFNEPGSRQPDRVQSMAPTVLVADAHERYRSGLVRAITAHPELKCEGVSDHGVAALALILRRRPAVAVLDVRLPGLDGFAIGRRLRNLDLRPRTQVVLLSAMLDEPLRRRARALGAPACLSKDTSRQEICAALVAIARGRSSDPDTDHAPIRVIEPPGAAGHAPGSGAADKRGIELFGPGDLVGVPRMRATWRCWRSMRPGTSWTRCASRFLTLASLSKRWLATRSSSGPSSPALSARPTGSRSTSPSSTICEWTFASSVSCGAWPDGGGAPGHWHAGPVWPQARNAGRPRRCAPPGGHDRARLPGGPRLGHPHGGGLVIGSRRVARPP